MNIINATEARAKLYTLIDETADSHQPVIITGKRGNAVLVSEEDWNAMKHSIFFQNRVCGNPSKREWSKISWNV